MPYLLFEYIGPYNEETMPPVEAPFTDWMTWSADNTDHPSSKPLAFHTEGEMREEMRRFTADWQAPVCAHDIRVNIAGGLPDRGCTLFRPAANAPLRVWSFAFEWFPIDKDPREKADGRTGRTPRHVDGSPMPQTGEHVLHASDQER